MVQCCRLWGHNNSDLAWQLNSERRDWAICCRLVAASLTASLTRVWLWTGQVISPLLGVLICKIRDLGFANPVCSYCLFLYNSLHQWTGNTEFLERRQSDPVWTRSIATLFFFFLILTGFYFILFYFNFFFFCSEFCHTLEWKGLGFTRLPHPDPRSHFPLHPLPPGLPRAPGPSACLMHPTLAGDLFHPW